MQGCTRIYKDVRGLCKDVEELCKDVHVVCTRKQDTALLCNSLLIEASSAPDCTRTVQGLGKDCARMYMYKETGHGITAILC